MRTFLTTALLTITSLSTWAQDILFFHDGRELQAKVTEVGANEVKYHRFDNLDGPVFVTPKAELFMIKYKNGAKEMIQATAPAATQVAPAPVQQAPQTFSQPSNNRPGPTVSAHIQRENQEKYDLYRRKVKNKTRTGVGFMAAGGGLFLIGAGLLVRGLAIGTPSSYDGSYRADPAFYSPGGGIMGLGAVFMIIGGSSLGWASKYRRMAREVDPARAYIAPSIIRFDGHEGGVGQSQAYGVTLKYQF